MNHSQLRFEVKDYSHDRMERDFMVGGVDKVRDVLLNLFSQYEKPSEYQFLPHPKMKEFFSAYKNYVGIINSYIGEYEELREGEPLSMDEFYDHWKVVHYPQGTIELNLFPDSEWGEEVGESALYWGTPVITDAESVLELLSGLVADYRNTGCVSEETVINTLEDFLRTYLGTYYRGDDESGK